MSKDVRKHRNPDVRWEILWYIDLYKECNHGFSPTVREIFQELHISGGGVVNYSLNRMENDGWITSRPTAKGNRKPGSIELTEEGRAKLQAYLQQHGRPPYQLALTALEAESAGPDAQPPGDPAPPAAPPVLPVLEEPPAEDPPPARPPRRVYDVGQVILSARITNRSRGARTVTIPVLNLIAASYGFEQHSSDFSVGALDPECYLNISEDMLGRYKVEDLFALQVRGDSMIEAGIQSGDYVILKNTQTAENGDMCAIWIDHKEATLKYFFREEKRVRLEAANQKIAPRLIGPRHSVVIQGKVVLVVRI